MEKWQDNFVVVMADFKKSNKGFKFENKKFKSFSGFVSYINRDEAVDKFNDYKDGELPSTDFKKMISYQNREKAVFSSDDRTAAFNLENDSLSREQLQQFQKNVEQAEQEGSPLWRQVISFKPEFLLEQGLITLKDPSKPIKNFKEDVVVDQQAIRSAVSHALGDKGGFFDKAGFKDNYKWIGDIHLNTDQLHIHVMGVEVGGTNRPITKNGEIKGKLAQKDLDWLKKDIYSNLNKENRMPSIDFSIGKYKKEVIDSFKNQLDVKQRSYLFKKVWETLPENKNLWRAGTKAAVMEEPLGYARLLVGKYLEGDNSSQLLFDTVYKNKLLDIQITQHNTETEAVRKAKEQAEEWKTTFEKDLVQKLLTSYRNLSDKDFEEDLKTHLMTIDTESLKDEIKNLKLVKGKKSEIVAREFELRRRSLKTNIEFSSEAINNLTSARSNIGEAVFAANKAIAQLYDFKLSEHSNKKELNLIALKPRTYRTGDEVKTFDNLSKTLLEPSRIAKKKFNNETYLGFKRHATQELDVITKLGDVSNWDKNVKEVFRSAYGIEEKQDLKIAREIVVKNIQDKLKFIEQYKSQQVKIIPPSSISRTKPYRPSSQFFNRPKQSSLRKMEDDMNMFKKNRVLSILEQEIEERVAELERA